MLSYFSLSDNDLALVISGDYSEMKAAKE